MIFLALKGFSLLHLGILEGFFHITSFLMEVPTGAVADIYGRKVSRITGRLSFLFSLAFMFFADSLSGQMAGFALCAIGYNLESGAGEALVYDSLKFLKREDEFKKIKGKEELCYQSASIIAFSTGGFLALRNYSWLFIATAAMSVLALVTALFMKEAPFKSKKHNESLTSGIIKSIVGQTRDSIRIVKERPRITLLIIFTELCFTFSVCAFFYLQNYWKLNGRTEIYIGLVFSIQALAAGLTSFAAPVVEKKMGEKKILVFMPLLLIICLWIIGLSEYRAIAFILTGISEGIIIVAVSDYLNKLIPSQNRATILSFQSMAFSLFMIMLFPLTGYLGDLLNLQMAFTINAVLATLLYIFFLLSIRNRQPKNQAH